MNAIPIRSMAAWALAAVLAVSAVDAQAAKKKKKAEREEDPFSEYVWPPPPNDPKIKLHDVIKSRADVEAKTRWKKILLGASEQTGFDGLGKPFAVAFDSGGRILVTDQELSALFRFDREGRRMDVFGTRGAVRLRRPLGLEVGPDDTAYIADSGLAQVVALDSEGLARRLYGREGELRNPTDAALSPDGATLYVTDSMAHQIVLFDVATGERVSAFGSRGTGDGEFNYPTALTFGPEGHLFVVDQASARVQVLSPRGEYLDEFGGRGAGFGRFTRPKDVAVDDAGFIYVTDNAFNNVQLFDADFTLLTFVGEGGAGPGRFIGASGVAVRGDEFAVVDQVGARLQVFRFIAARSGG